MTKSLVLALPVVLVLSSCASGGDSVPVVPEQLDAPSNELIVLAPRVIVSNSILGSVVGDIMVCAVGDAQAMTVLMPLGTDPHDFQPSSEQVASMVRSDVVVVNGLGLEQGLEGGIAAARADGAAVFEVAPFVDPLEWSGVDDGHGHDEAEPHGELDPHFWFDMNRMALAAELIGAQLAEVSEEDVFQDCGLEVANGIRASEVELQTILSVVSLDARLLVTDHEALGYFADRYGFTVIGVVIPGGTTMGAPDSRALANLVSTIKKNQVPAIFGNTALNPAVLESLAAEVGNEVAVVELFVESLGGADSGASRYTEMMLTNGTRIAQALRD